MSIQMLTVDQAASALAVHPETVRRMIKRGEIAAVKVARRWRINSNELQKIATAPPIALQQMTDKNDNNA